MTVSLTVKLLLLVVKICLPCEYTYRIYRKCVNLVCKIPLLSRALGLEAAAARPSARARRKGILFTSVNLDNWSPLT